MQQTFEKYSELINSRADRLLREIEIEMNSSSSEFSADVGNARHFNAFVENIQRDKQRFGKSVNLDTYVSYGHTRAFGCYFSQVPFITEEALEICYKIGSSGIGKVPKAKDFFSPWTGKNDQRVVLGEHIRPINTLKRHLAEAIPDNRSFPNTGYARILLQKNVQAILSAREDKLLTDSSLSREMPDESDFWSRYRTVGLDLLLMHENIISSTGKFSGDANAIVLKIAKRATRKIRNGRNQIFETVSFAEFRNSILA